MAKVDIEAIGEALYTASQPLGPEKLFSQEDFLDLGVVPANDVGILAECLNSLAGDGLVKLMNKDGRSHWKVVSREEAAKYQTLTQDEALIYSYIESAGREGIWVKMIRTKSNLHQTPLNKGLKTLENKGLVKQLQTQRVSGRRIYMLSGLQPPEEISGGPFYNDGKMDNEFIEIASFWLEREIAGKSWHHTPVRSSKKKRVKIARDHDAEENDDSQKESKNKRVKIEVDHNDEKVDDQPKDISPYAESKEHAATTIHTLLPPGYTGYPTISELTQGFNISGVAKVKLKEDEVGQLVNLLCWDGKVERVRCGEKEGYRTIHPENLDRGLGKTAFTAAPCGRCPVFDLCEDEGPVNARTCVYYKGWLSEFEAEVF